MAGKPKLEDDPLWEVATYLARPETRVEFHAELPPKSQTRFEAEYAAATNGHPTQGSRGSYYVLTPNVNKHGRELRIYFVRESPEPPIIQRSTQTMASGLSGTAIASTTRIL